MNTAFPLCPNHAEWKTLYRAAILESDRSVIPQKLSEAEAAALARRKELFCCVSSEEKESLEDALYLLRAYRTALECAELDITGDAVKAAA
jgi:hypothetical protein